MIGIFIDIIIICIFIGFFFVILGVWCLDLNGVVMI